MFRNRQRAGRKASRLIYLVATAGHPNLGDELILKNWLTELARMEPDAQVWVDCPSPGPAAALLHDAHPHVRFVDTLFRMSWEAPDGAPAAVEEFVFRALEQPGETPRWIPGIEVLRRADVFHIVGGGYLNTIWPRHAGILAASRYLAGTTQPRIAATGLGLLPAEDGMDELWRTAAASFDVFTVRDAPSLEIFGGQGPARLAPDDIFLSGLGVHYAADAASAPRSMVCVQDDLLDTSFDEVSAAVRATLRTWGAADEPIGVVECIPRGDRRIYDVLLDEFPSLRFYSLWEILRDGFPAAGHQRWISSRYHPHILAAGAGASGLTLSVRRGYYDIKHGAVRTLGSGWLPLGEPGAARVGGPGSLPERADEHAGELRTIARDVYA